MDGVRVDLSSGEEVTYTEQNGQKNGTGTGTGTDYFQLYKYGYGFRARTRTPGYGSKP